jgi:hypothetical protein
LLACARDDQLHLARCTLPGHGGGAACGVRWIRRYHGKRLPSVARHQRRELISSCAAALLQSEPPQALTAAAEAAGAGPTLQPIELPVELAAAGLEFYGLETELFAAIRSASSIEAASIVADVTAGGKGLRRVPTAAKGHADFFLSESGAYLIKMIKATELKTLAEMLPSYMQHLEGEGSGSLLNRMCCLFAVTQPASPDSPAASAHARAQATSEEPVPPPRVRRPSRPNLTTCPLAA